MDYDNCRDLSIQLLGKYLKDVIREHVLTVIDAHWPHALIGAVRDEIDRWYVVATPRPDAVENAEKLAAELGPKASVVLNQKGGMVDSIALSGIERALELPVVKEPDRWDGKPGQEGAPAHLWRGHLGRLRAQEHVRRLSAQGQEEELIPAAAEPQTRPTKGIGRSI